MKTIKSLPDNVVFNTETQRYDAAIKPYATSLGAPVIAMNDTTAWKNKSINNINHKVKAQYAQLKKAYEKMMEEFEYNRLILSAQFNFEPIIGEVYHLYQRDKGEMFLSIIAPEECHFKWAGSFYLSTDQIWEKV